MATSTLDPENLPEPDRRVRRGHGTSALGPSNTSDSGSDVQSGLRWADEDGIGLDKGTYEDPDSAKHDRSAGPDIGDAELDSDTDAEGTGEHASAGRDLDIEAGADIDVDRIDDATPGEDPDFEGPEDLDAMPPRTRHPNRQAYRR